MFSIQQILLVMLAIGSRIVAVLATPIASHSAAMRGSWEATLWELPLLDSRAWDSRASHMRLCATMRCDSHSCAPMVFIHNFTATHAITSAYNVVHILLSTFVANYKVS